MVKVKCKTSIDCWKNLQWPETLPARPMIGDSIYSITRFPHRQMRNEMIHIEARISSVAFKPKMQHNPVGSSMYSGEYYMELQLWLPEQYKGGLPEYWDTYWTPITGLSRG